LYSSPVLVHKSIYDGPLRENAVLGERFKQFGAGNLVPVAIKY
jgi:hypothetical protein